MTGAAVAAIHGRDITPDAINWANISMGNSTTADNADQTISGFQGPIVLRLLSSGGAGVDFTIQPVVNTVSVGSPISGGGASTDFTVFPGDQIHFHAISGLVDGGATLSVQNVTAGVVTLDTFTLTIA